jgi:hypothetical protein
MSTDVSEPRAPTLAELDEAGRYAAFDRLQERLPGIWQQFQKDIPGESVVVVPSMTVDKVTAGSGSLNQAMEERFLFLLLLLRQPRLRMVYVTSMPIDPLVIDYYLSLLPGVIPSHARARLTLVPVGDSSPAPLTDKLLARPRVLQAITDAVPDPAVSHLIPYTSTTRERDLALELGIPMYSADPRLLELGTKTGCRRLFGEAGVTHPLGEEDLHSVEEVGAALGRICAARPGIEWAIVKLNEGASGSGNALVDLRSPGGEPLTREELEERVRTMQLETDAFGHAEYFAKLEERGGIVEERIVGEEVRSPSVQLRVTPGGSLEILSTHDQILGGPSGQAYLGARFPADPGYAVTMTDAARRVGERLRDLGVVGRFAIDFLTVRRGGQWETWAIELNLRRGGTTHPFLTLQYLTDGRYEPASGRYLTPLGAERHLVATDHLEDPRLRGLHVPDLFDVVARAGLHFDQARQTGVVFHMLSCLTEHGRVGLTAIGETPEAAQAFYDRAEAALREEGRAALTPRPLPG